MKRIVTYDADRMRLSKFHDSNECEYVKRSEFKVVLLDEQVKLLQLSGCKVCVRFWDDEKGRYFQGGKL